MAGLILWTVVKDLVISRPGSDGLPLGTLKLATFSSESWEQGADMSSPNRDMAQANPADSLKNALKALQAEASALPFQSRARDRIIQGNVGPMEILRLITEEKAVMRELAASGLDRSMSGAEDTRIFLETKWERLDRVLGPEPWEGNLEDSLKYADILKPLDFHSFAQEETANIPPRTWFIDGTLTQGFNVCTAKKGIGKTFFLLQAANSIALGIPFLGRRAKKSRVLYVPLELDRIAIHERARKYAPCAEDMLIIYEWPSGRAALERAEAVILGLGVQIIIFDMFLAIMPEDLQGRTNDYGTSSFFREWRLLGQKYGVAIVAVWHSGKGDREDFMSSALGTTGLTGQADVVLSLDRKRGESGAKLYIGGNHGREEALSLVFEDCTWSLGNDSVSPSLSRLDEELLKFVNENPEGIGPTEAASGLSRTYDNARMSLSRLSSRGYIRREGRGRYFPVLSEQTEQNRTDTDMFGTE